MKDIEKTVYKAIKNGTYTTFDTLKDSYEHLYEEIIALQAENERLTKLLENSVQLPAMRSELMQIGWIKIRCMVYFIITKDDIELHFDKLKAEARLAELEAQNDNT